jgi:hypothetical protein
LLCSILLFHTSVWKLHITPPAVRRQQRETRPIFNLRRNPVSEVEELVDLFFGLHESTLVKSGTPESKQSQGSEGAESQEAQDNAGEGEASPKEGEEGSPKEEQKAEGEGEEVKSKPSQHDREEEGEESLPKRHCYRVKRVGLWDPFLSSGLFEPSRVFGAPVGYHVTWGPRSSITCF